MLDLQQLQVLAQLIDNMELATKKLEKAYSKNDAQDFTKSKQEIAKIQIQISEIVSGRKLK